MADNTFARSLHDLGLAGWFGGSLMGATAVNRAAADVQGDEEAGRAVNGVWRRWWLVNAACMGAHLAGGAGLTAANKARLAVQPEAVAAAKLKVVVTGAAVGASAYAGYLGKQISDAGDLPVEDGTTPTDSTPEPAATALRRQSALQWIIPVLTGTLVVIGAKQGEQQRPSNVLASTVRRLAGKTSG